MLASLNLLSSRFHLHAIPHGELRRNLYAAAHLISHDQEQRYRSHFGKSSVGEALAPVNGFRGDLQRRGIQPKDHARENFLALREKQRENREKQEEAVTRCMRLSQLNLFLCNMGQDRPKVELFKLEKFKLVQSKIATVL